MNDNFNFDLVTSFAGYVSSRDKTNIVDNILVRGSVNVYKKISGTIASRPGLKQRGPADTAQAGVTSSFTWYTSLGKTIPLRVANGKLQFESDIVLDGTYVWYDLLTSLTATRFVFDSWWDNTEKKDRLVFVKGDTNLHHWSGGIAILASATVNTITKTGTTTWAQEGFYTNTAGDKKVVINGTTYTYTGGENTTTLTGVTADPSGEAANSIAIQLVGTLANTPASTMNNDFLRNVGNRIFVGSYTSRIIYWSKSTDYTNFTPTVPSPVGDAGFMVLDSTAKGIGIRKGSAYVGGGLSDWYVITFPTQTVGSSIIEVASLEKIRMSNLAAPYAHEFIDTVGDDLIYLSQDQQLRMYGSFRNLFTDKFPSLSIAVQNELAEENFAGGHLKAISNGSLGDIVYITAPASGKDYMYQIRETIDSQGNITTERLWHPPQVRNVSRFEVIDGVIFGHSNANPMIYQIWDTGQWYDDSPSGEQLGYDCYMRMSYKHISDKQGVRRQGLLSAGKAYFEGYMANGVNLNCNFYANYQGNDGIQQLNINSIAYPAKFFSGSTVGSIGSSPIGDKPIGDGIVNDPNDQELLPKFRAIPGLNPVNIFEYQMEVFSNDINSRWEILALGVNAEMQNDQAVFLHKKS